MVRTTSTMKNSQPQIPSKEARASFCPSKTLHTTKRHNKMRESPHRKGTMFKLSHKIRKNQTSQLNSKRAHRSRSFSFIPLTTSLSFLASSKSSASSDSDSEVTLCFAMPGSRVSPADFTAAASAALLPYVLDKEHPATLEPCASSRSVVALCLAIPDALARFDYCKPAVLPCSVPTI